MAAGASQDRRPPRPTRDTCDRVAAPEVREHPSAAQVIFGLTERFRTLHNQLADAQLNLVMELHRTHEKEMSALRRVVEELRSQVARQSSAHESDDSQSAAGDSRPSPPEDVTFEPTEDCDSSSDTVLFPNSVSTSGNNSRLTDQLTDDTDSNGDWENVVQRPRSSTPNKRTFPEEEEEAEEDDSGEVRTKRPRQGDGAGGSSLPDTDRDQEGSNDDVDQTTFPQTLGLLSSGDDSQPEEGWGEARRQENSSANLRGVCEQGEHSRQPHSSVGEPTPQSESAQPPSVEGRYYDFYDAREISSTNSDDRDIMKKALLSSKCEIVRLVGLHGNEDSEWAEHLLRKHGDSLVQLQALAVTGKQLRLVQAMPRLRRLELVDWSWNRNLTTQPRPERLPILEELEVFLPLEYAASLMQSPKLRTVRLYERTGWGDRDLGPSMCKDLDGFLYSVLKDKSVKLIELRRTVSKSLTSSLTHTFDYCQDQLRKLREKFKETEIICYDCATAGDKEILKTVDLRELSRKGNKSGRGQLFLSVHPGEVESFTGVDCYDDKPKEGWVKMLLKKHGPWLKELQIWNVKKGHLLQVSKMQSLRRLAVVDVNKSFHMNDSTSFSPKLEWLEVSLPKEIMFWLITANRASLKVLRLCVGCHSDSEDWPNSCSDLPERLAWCRLEKLELLILLRINTKTREVKHTKGTCTFQKEGVKERLPLVKEILCNVCDRVPGTEPFFSKLRVSQ